MYVNAKVYKRLKGVGVRAGYLVSCSSGSSSRLYSNDKLAGLGVFKNKTPLNTQYESNQQDCVVQLCGPQLAWIPQALIPCIKSNDALHKKLFTGCDLMRLIIAAPCDTKYCVVFETTSSFLFRRLSSSDFLFYYTNSGKASFGPVGYEVANGIKIRRVCFHAKWIKLDISLRRPYNVKKRRTRATPTPQLGTPGLTIARLLSAERLLQPKRNPA